MYQNIKISYTEKLLKTKTIINYKEEMIIKSEYKAKNLKQKLT